MQTALQMKITMTAILIKDNYLGALKVLKLDNTVGKRPSNQIETLWLAKCSL